MRESRTSGFVRGARSNMCPYRDRYLPETPPCLSRCGEGERRDGGEEQLADDGHRPRLLGECGRRVSRMV